MAQQETSALFSLNELMRLEEDRVRSEQKLRREQAEAAERARRETERAAREREVATQRAAEERRQEDERRALSLQRAHERELATVGESKTKTRLRWALWLGSASCVACIAALVLVYFVRIRPRADREGRALETMVQAQRLQRDQMQRDLDEYNSKVRELEERVKAEQEAARNLSRPQPKATGARPPSARPHQKTPPRERPVCTCDQHDPLCPCWASH